MTDREAAYDAARLRFADVCMDPLSTEDDYLTAQRALTAAEKARRAAPGSLAGVRDGRVL